MQRKNDDKEDKNDIKQSEIRVGTGASTIHLPPIVLAKLDYSKQLRSMSKWKDGVLNTIKASLKTGSNTNELFFLNELFHPAAIHIYKDLQEEIAKLIPEEYKRPTIILHIHGDNRPARTSRSVVIAGEKADLGLVGGTGPLSDAHIVTKLIDRRIKDKRSLENVNIVLQSCPPPRPDEGRVNRALHLTRYIKKTISFAKENYDFYALLSNTAHANASKFQNRLNRPEQLLHLVNDIADHVKQDHPGKVLVLGTLEAANVNLYPNALQHRGVVSVMPSASPQEKLQDYIDKIKSGKLKEIGDQFVDFMFDQIKSASNPSHVILGCTEIPLFLQTVNAAKGKTYMTLLTDKISAAGLTMPTFIDSEEEMVNALYKAQIQQENTKINKLQAVNEGYLSLSEGTDRFIDFKHALLNCSDSLNFTTLKNQIAHCDNYKQIKNILHDFFERHKDFTDVTNAIVASICKPATAIERRDLIDDIGAGRFNTVEVRFLERLYDSDLSPQQSEHLALNEKSEAPAMPLDVSRSAPHSPLSVQMSPASSSKSKESPPASPHSPASMLTHSEPSSPVSTPTPKKYGF